MGFNYLKRFCSKFLIFSCRVDVVMDNNIFEGGGVNLEIGCVEISLHLDLPNKYPYLVIIESGIGLNEIILIFDRLLIFIYRFLFCRFFQEYFPYGYIFKYVVAF